jgi:hypothetical protein
MRTPFKNLSNETVLHNTFVCSTPLSAKKCRTERSYVEEVNNDLIMETSSSELDVISSSICMSVSRAALESPSVSVDVDINNNCLINSRPKSLSSNSKSVSFLGDNNVRRILQLSIPQAGVYDFIDNSSDSIDKEPINMVCRKLIMKSKAKTSCRKARRKMVVDLDKSSSVAVQLFSAKKSSIKKENLGISQNSSGKFRKRLFDPVGYDVDKAFEGSQLMEF